jgi:hypothetical protein
MNWTVLFTNTSLKLALNLVIFSIFSSNFTIKLRSRECFFSFISFRKRKLRLFLIQQAQTLIDCHAFSQRNDGNLQPSFSVHVHFSPFLYVFQNVCQQFFYILCIVIYNFFHENAWKPKTVGARWIQKSLKFLFLEDLHEKK